MKPGKGLVVLALLCVILSGCTNGKPTPQAVSPTASVASPSPSPASPAATATSTAQYFDGDARLGPAVLPTTGTVADELRFYDRLGGLSVEAFVAKYWDASANSGKGSWRYPPNNGFLVGPDGKPIESAVDLVTGTALDRFGSEFGTFLAPQGALYAERSIPPQNLNTFDPAYPYNYHEYRVLRAFEVEDGPVAPAFGEPGLGIQLLLDPSLLPGAPTSGLNVMWLLQNGYVQRLN